MDIKEIQFNTEVWKEGDMYIVYVPQLDLSSCGTTVEEAKKNIKEATEAYLEEAKNRGTLNEILEEAGFSFGKIWNAPELIAFERMKLAF